MFFGAGLSLCGGAMAQVNIPEGFEIVEFADTSQATGWPRINNCGQVVFWKGFADDYGAEILVYDNGRIIQITDNDVPDSFPDINDSGTVVWAHDSRNPSKGTILFDDGERVLSLGKGTQPSINGPGLVAWKRFHGGGCASASDIYLFDGKSTRQFFSDGFSNQSVEINDSGDMVWTRYNFCSRPHWIGDIVLFTDGYTRVLNDSTTQSQVPELNNLGSVVWLNAGAIEVWKDGAFTQLSLGAPPGNPTVNDSGDMLIPLWDANRREWDMWMYRMEDERRVAYLLTDDPFVEAAPQINEFGEGAWPFTRQPSEGDWSGGVRLLRRKQTGDGDLDGAVDLSDAGKLVGCLTGPEWVKRTQPGPRDCLCDCRFLDTDYDGDVDLADFATLQNRYDPE